MARAFKIESTVIINGSNFARATAIAGRLSSVSKKIDAEGNSELSAEVRKLANSYFSAIETGIARATGSKKIKEQSGRGLQVDLISVDLRNKKVNVSEVKGSLIQSMTKKIKGRQTLALKRTSAISLGSAIKLGTSGQSRLTTGYAVGENGQILEQVEDLTELEKFVKYYKGDIEKLRAHLKAPSKQTNDNLRKILTAVSKNLETKALTLQLPFNINNRQTGLTTLKFTRSFILNEANIEYKSDTDTIDITFKYRQKVINEGLALATKNPEIVKATKNYNINFARILDTQIGKLPKDASRLSYFSSLLTAVEKELNSKEFSADIIFNKGSVLAYKGSIRVLESKKQKAKIDSMPTVIDISALVQGRTRLKMRRGSGEPRPKKIYERSGTFRQSIEAYADFRDETIRYFYEPYYDSLERYGYQIEDLVEGSIRSIARQYFNKQFNLVRTNT
jgi:hypothetical protein